VAGLLGMGCGLLFAHEGGYTASGAGRPAVHTGRWVLAYNWGHETS
jgi:hypothetical protein